MFSFSGVDYENVDPTTDQRALADKHKVAEFNRSGWANDQIRFDAEKQANRTDVSGLDNPPDAKSFPMSARMAELRIGFEMVFNGLHREMGGQSDYLPLLEAEDAITPGKPHNNVSSATPPSSSGAYNIDSWDKNTNTSTGSGSTSADGSHSHSSTGTPNSCSAGAGIAEGKPGSLSSMISALRRWVGRGH